ncbi:glucose 1-dehydrogenase [Corynebacterium halotolerans]|uniref:glucose 1-dehydrogenase n=1 Tax=Corynebacterium halotolerans TaxID=225326 RepID=UPI003CEF46E9
MGRVDSKVVIVTGAGNGIGASSAHLLAREGAKVVVTDIDEAAGTRVAEDIGDNAIFVKQDVASEADWANVVQRAEESFGPVAGLVNNAGIVGPNDVALADLRDEDFQKVLQVNVYSVFKGMQSVLGSMKENGGGSIVNVSSTSGLVGSVNVTSYVTTKFAVRGITKAAALEFAEHGVRVNSVHPGGIRTNIEVFDAVKAATPLGRIAEPEEVSNLILYLISDEASFSTGSEFVVDGGFTAQ